MACMFACLPWTLILSFSILALIYIFYRKRYRYWKDMGIQGPEPSLVFGNLRPSKKFAIGTFLENLYEQYNNLPYIGIYMMHRPALMVNDLELIKTILIKDFAHFTDHGLIFDIKTQPLANHLFNSNGARWKSLRNKLTPVFTSSKMKYMFDTMAKCGEELEAYLKVDADAKNEIDFKETIAKFSTNVIASSAFGIDSNCFKYPDSEFRTMGKKIFQFDFKRTLAILLNLTAPDIQKIWNGKFIQEDVSKFFIGMVEKTIKYREDNGISKNDLMQLLIRLKNNETIYDKDEAPKELQENEVADIHLNNVEIASQAFGFFIGGFETSSTTSSFALYELCKYPEYQDKLRKEINDVLEKHKKITYEAINEMTYLTQVIDETLRIHSIAPQIIRICVKDYTIPNTNILIKKGTPIFISNQGVHKDSKYYPEPEAFNPDNFSAENKAKREHFTYFPFGEGPRMCIGQRFAMMQIKIALVSILSKYQVSLPDDFKEIEKENPILLTPKNMILKIQNHSI